MEIINQLRSQGINISLVGDKLKIEPRERVTPELVEKIKAHRQEIARELRQAQETKTPASYCSWLKAEVDECQLPCWAWDKDKGNGRTCEHLRQYMVSIGRWTA